MPLHRVEDDDGNLMGNLGCRFFERREVERDDFDAGAGCPVPTVVER